MKIISHRGGAGLAPENSLDAIKVSKALGVYAAEVDLHITKDNKLVVFHDYDLKRLAGVNKDINQLSLNEISKITLKNGTTIPTLSEVIKTAGDLKLIIEGKGGNWSKLLDSELQKHRFNIKPDVISFNESELSKFHELNNEIDCYLIEIFRGLNTIKHAKKNGFIGIDIHYLGMNPIVYKAAKQNNLKVIVYTINSTKMANFYNKHYPDIYITSDSPDQLLHLIKNIT